MMRVGALCVYSFELGTYLRVRRAESGVGSRE